MQALRFCPCLWCCFLSLLHCQTVCWKTMTHVPFLIECSTLSGNCLKVLVSLAVVCVDNNDCACTQWSQLPLETSRTGSVSQKVGLWTSSRLESLKNREDDCVEDSLLAKKSDVHISASSQLCRCLTARPHGACSRLWQV